MGAHERSVDVDFTVARPTFTLGSTSTNLNPAIDIRGGNTRLEFGEPGIQTDGIKIEAVVTAPAAGAGKVGFIQLVMADRRETLDNNDNRKWTTDEDWVLDDSATAPFYFAPIAVGVGFENRAFPYLADSPYNPLGPAAEVAGNPARKASSASDSFIAYLMYRPGTDEDDCIWVTLGIVEWYWEADATKVNNVWGVNNADYPDPLAPPPGQNTHLLPYWSQRITAIGWQADD